MRVCDRCGTKSAPYHPRKRVGEELLCAACAKAPVGVSAGGVISEAARRPRQTSLDIGSLTPQERLDPTKYEKDTPDYVKGHGMAGGDDDWGTPDDNQHSLQQALPNSVWNNYHKARKHKGEPLLSRKACRDLKVPYRSLSKQLVLDRWRKREDDLRKQAHEILNSNGEVEKHTHHIPDQMLPPTTSKQDALDHLAEHHPEISAEDYDGSEFSKPGGGFLKGWHEHLHQPKKTQHGDQEYDQDGVSGYYPQDGHQHDKPTLPEAPGDIDMLDHVEGHHHGWMPFEDKEEAAAHHQHEHDRGKDDEIGHSHEYAGGPPVSPINALVNPHHSLMNPGGPGVMEWYHGTPRDYEGAPQTTTENHEQGLDTGYGEGDWNCGAAEERFLTTSGITTLGEAAGSTQEVLTRVGGNTQWVKAEIKEFGKQSLMALTLRRGRETKVVYWTPNHRWFIRSRRDRNSDYREVVTSDLSPGDVLASALPNSRVRQSRPSPQGVARGIVYGDGNVLQSGSVVDLFGDKNLDLVRFFAGSHIRPRAGRGKDGSLTGMQVCDLPRYYKTQLPDLDENPSYLYGWLAGYFAADGTVNTSGVPILYSADLAALEYVEVLCLRLGIGTKQIKTQYRKGYGATESPMYRIEILRSTVSSDFFVCANHKERFDNVTRVDEIAWTVVSVEQTDRTETVYCAVVPDTHTFVLADYIYTGNCHVGSHWSSLHKMANDFHGNTKRVIHAQLKIKNPKVYDNLNHMAHDAYERLYAQGEFQDSPHDRHHDNGHEDDSGYNQCCSGSLLEYAKGGAGRNDGKNGLQRYRDSLRADGHDGILVRNQADHPSGHWNAMALSPDQIDIKDAHCPEGHDHGDERTNDKQQFLDNHDKVMKQPDGSTWEKGYSTYRTPNDLPDSDAVDAVHAGKEPEDSHHNDPDYDGDWSSGNEDEGGGIYCESCDEFGNHEESEHWEYCPVCEEDSEHGGDSMEYGPHDHCEHCDDWADHDSDNHEDEWGDKPDEYRNEDYCPHCGDYDKNNRDEANCVNCDKQLPDWGQIKTKGMPHDYKYSDVEKSRHPYDPAGGDANAPEHSGKTGWLAMHLNMHHGSDDNFEGFDNPDGSTNADALNEHHKWLHMGGDAVGQAGYDVDHKHAAFATHNNHDDMSDEDFKAHMGIHHPGIPTDGDHSSMESMKSNHDNAHGHPWGVSGNGDLVGKTPLHNHEGDPTSPGAKANAPMMTAHPDDLLGHFIGYHAIGGKLNEQVLANSTPEEQQAAHSALHQTTNISQTPWQKHEHNDDGSPEFTDSAKKFYDDHDGNGQGKPEDMHAHAQLLSHLVKTHGNNSTKHGSISSLNYESLMEQHAEQHATDSSIVQHPSNDHSNPEIPSNLGEGVKNWMIGKQNVGGGYQNNNDEAIENHLGEHGYSGVVPQNNKAKHEIHKHLHDNPDNLPKGVAPADHQHPTSSDEGHYDVSQKMEKNDPEDDYSGEDHFDHGDSLMSLNHHLMKGHPDINLEHPNSGDHGMNEEQYKKYLVKTHGEHHEQKAADPQTPGFHTHAPDPDPPQFPDDPTKNDDLVKHLMSDHQVHSSKLEPLSHEEMVKHHIDHHLGAKEAGGDATSAEGAKAPLDNHKHSQDDFENKLHVSPASGGLPGVLPAANDHTELSEHLAGYHQHDQETHEGKSKEFLQTAHALEHQDGDASHTHLGPANSPHEYDSHKMEHLHNDHGMTHSPMEHAMPTAHWDELHAHLHGDGSSPLLPTKQAHPLITGKPIGHHHG